MRSIKLIKFTEQHQCNELLELHHIFHVVDYMFPLFRLDMSLLNAANIHIISTIWERNGEIIPHMPSNMNIKLFTGEHLKPSHKPNRKSDDDRDSIVIGALLLLGESMKCVCEDQHCLNICETESSRYQEYMDTCVNNSKHQWQRVAFFYSHYRSHEGVPEQDQDEGAACQDDQWVWFL